MVNWKYIATQLAQKNKGGLGHWTKEHLARSWYSLYVDKVGSYASLTMMGETLATMYNMFMTIANFPSLTDKEKGDKILFLLKTITDGYDEEEVREIFKDGGFPEETELEIKQKRPFLSREFHPQVIKHAGHLFNDGYYSSSVNEACKAYNKAVQKKAHSTLDGQSLMFAVFGTVGSLRVNPYATRSEVDAQEGIKFISGGLMTGFRNPTAHETSHDLEIPLQECIEILGMISYLFRQLDKATKRT